MLDVLMLHNPLKCVGFYSKIIEVGEQIVRANDLSTAPYIERGNKRDSAITSLEKLAPNAGLLSGNVQCEIKRALLMWRLHRFAEVALNRKMRTI